MRSPIFRRSTSDCGKSSRNPQAFTEIPDEVRKCLKGKSCFNIKKADDKLFKQIEKMAKQGFKLYKQEKWI